MALFFNLFIYSFVFGCAGSLLLCGFSLVAVRGGYSPVPVCGFLTVLASLAVEDRLSSCGAWVQVLRGMWDLHRPGVKPTSSALPG